VQDADLHNKAIFEASNELVEKLREAKNRLISLVESKKSSENKRASNQQ
jgi:hypothetical protein